jgi:hypothetical protein
LAALGELRNGMGKRVCETGSGHRRSAVVLALLAALLVAGCAQKDRAADDENRSGGFYGGVSGGLTR